MKEGVHDMNVYLDTVSRLCRDIDTSNRSTRDFIERVATGWVDMATKRFLHLPSFADGGDALQALANLIDNTRHTGEDDIELYFGEPIAHGSFKECYDLTPEYIIKFCAMRNPTLDEQSILVSAAEHNMKHFFVPSFYIQLPRAIDSKYLDKDDDDAEVYDPDTHQWTPNLDWVDNSQFTYICIQPRVEPLGDSEENAVQFHIAPHLWRDMFDAIPELRNENLNDWAALDGACLNWLADFGYYYGLTGLERLRDFCETFGIWDLHAENTCHLIPSVSGRAAPAILDWMSR